MLHIWYQGGAVDLTVVTANMKGHSDLPENGGPGFIDWRARHERFAEIVAGSGAPPDLISITEFNGWTWCFPFWGVGDYDGQNVLINALERRTGLTYRVAYMLGRTGSLGGIGRTRCTYFSGDTVLYNPRRLVNLNSEDVPGRAVVDHDFGLKGLTLRRSLPICNPDGNQRPDMKSLIDGPPQTDKCNRATPSGPGWGLAVSVSRPDGTISNTIGASLGRFAFVHDPRASFDLFTVHPPSGHESEVLSSTLEFISGLSSPPDRNRAPMVPTLVVGDLNSLVRTPWLPNFQEVFSPDIDVLSVMNGTPQGSAVPRMTQIVQRKTVLPQGSTRCGPFPEEGQFSDHCALRVDFVDPTAITVATPETPGQLCRDQCERTFSRCMGDAHTGQDRGACVRANRKCLKACPT